MSAYRSIGYYRVETTLLLFFEAVGTKSASITSVFYLPRLKRLIKMFLGQAIERRSAVELSDPRDRDHLRLDRPSNSSTSLEQISYAAYMSQHVAGEAQVMHDK